MNQTYKQSTAALVVRLAVDFLLMIIIIGFYLVIKHLLPYTHNTVTLTDKSVILRRGVFSVATTEVPYTKINTVSVKVSLVGKLLDYGDVVIFTGNDASGIAFKSIQSPEMLKSKLQEKI